MFAVRKTILIFSLAFAPAIARGEPAVIAALGDSLIQGYGLPQKDGFAPRLEAWLRTRGADAIVLNAGVSGDTTQGGLSRIDWTLTPDVNALIVALGGNDLLRGIDPAVSRANLDGILKAAAQRGVPVLLVGLIAPGNYGPGYKAAFDAMYPELAARYGALHHQSFMAALSARAGERSALRKYMQADGIHPNKEGVVLIVEDLGPRVLELIGRIES